jgi:hypothetical protein
MRAAPASIDAYGFDCWKRKCHWSGTQHHWDHDPSKERAAMEALGFL